MDDTHRRTVSCRAGAIPAQLKNAFSGEIVRRSFGGLYIERFNFEKRWNARRRHSAARPEASGKTCFSARRQAAGFEPHSVSN